MMTQPTNAELDKRCTKCGIVKLYSEYYTYKKSKIGIRPECKECSKKINDSRKNRESIEAKTDGYKRCTVCGEQKHITKFAKHKLNSDGRAYTCKVCVREYQKEYNKRPCVRERTIIRSKNNWLQTNYGLTIDDWNNMIQKQNGSCAICKTKLDKGKSTHVDHNHENGEIRGILCADCNWAIGLFRDDISIIGNAINYLGGKYE